MSIPSEALDDLKYLGKRLKGVLALVPILEEYESLVNFIDEKRTEAARLEQEVNGIKVTLKTKTEEAHARDLEISRYMDEARKDAERIVSDAQTKASTILEEASSKVSKEETLAKEELSKINKDIYAARQKLVNLESRVKLEEDVLKELQTSIETLKNRFK